MVPNSKFKNLVEKLITKFQVKILKNVGGVAKLVIEIEQKAQMKIQLIFWPYNPYFFRDI